MAKIVDISERNLYLKNEDLDDAVSKYLKMTEAGRTRAAEETVPVTGCLGMVTAEPVFAKISSPYYNASAMDGICVKALEIVGVDERSPRVLTLHEDFEFVDTGDVIEEPYNAVVMI